VRVDFVLRLDFVVVNHFAIGVLRGRKLALAGDC
jgi:hypothetical protein